MNNLAVIDKEFRSILKKRGMLSTEMGSEISDSWARCISNGLDPFKGPKKSVISSQELDQIREEKEDLRKIVIPELELLYSQVAGTNFMVAFSDNEGLVKLSMQEYKLGDANRALHELNEGKVKGRAVLVP